jgi:hypothetical protein
MHNPTTVRDRDAPLTSGHTITVGGQLGETPGSETTLSTQQPLAMVEVQRRPSSSRRPSTPDGQAHKSSTQPFSTRRSKPPLHATLPPPSLHRVGTARSSPSMVTRTPPLPLRLPTLPILPPPTPPLPSPAKPRAPLRSMPALPVHGSADHGGESDHENSGLEDSDEDEDGEMADDVDGNREDTESDDGSQSAESHAGRRPRSRSRATQYPSRLPAVDTSRIDISFLDQVLDPAERRRGSEAEATPMASHSSDYFVARPNRERESSQSPNRTPQARDAPSSPFSFLRTPPPIPVSTPRVLHNVARGPSLHRRASRSMADLSAAVKREAPVINAAAPTEEVTHSKGKAREMSDMTQKGMELIFTESSKTASRVPAEDRNSNLRRQRSMPTFKPTSALPPYPSFSQHPMSKNVVVMPREDEGKEHLPPYSNSIYISSIMPRKLEFLSPGVQAKDRKWRRVLCILEGTVFRVYNCPRGAAGIGPIEEWWEKKVGVGQNWNVPNAAISNEVAKPERSKGRGGSEKLDLHNGTNPPSGSETSQDQPPTQSSLSLRSRNQRSGSLRRPSRPNDYSLASHWRNRSEIPSNTLQQSLGSTPSSSAISSGASSGRSDLSVNTDSTSVTPASSSSSTRSHFKFGLRVTGKPTPDSVDTGLIRSYTMQHAESGLGNDYLKRRNVIRVRLEGEQFLLQANDAAEVIEWIEVIVVVVMSFSH